MPVGSASIKGTNKKYNNGSLDGAWLDLEVFDSYEEFLEICALLHDDEEVPATAFKMKRLPRSMVLREMLQEITFDYKKRILLDV